MGGEKPVAMHSSMISRGSPPRGRGKAAPLYVVVLNLGITPAWAGKRAMDALPSAPAGDHPRVGGEKLILLVTTPGREGSPPRGRGKVPVCGHFGRHTGITPAWAGKRLSAAAFAFASWDHPRVGGEKNVMQLLRQFQQGSPPRGRGKVHGRRFQGVGKRITPAWAGKRLKRSHRSGIFISGPIPFHSVLHRPAGSGDSRAGRDGSPAGQPQNAGPA